MTNTGIPPLIQQMMQPGFYPHGVTEPIQMMQTHVSYVLLTGDYAYKVKKAVNFGFLDYSTVEARHHFCLEEIRLNQRTAPEIYLEVLPIVQVGDRFQLGTAGAENPVEYLLKMRAFNQDDLLSCRFEQGKLTEAEMEELGRVVAQFHAKAHRDDYIRSFGQVAKVREALDENYQQTQKYIGSAQTCQQYEETQAFTDEFFANRQALLNSRIENNWIRECHGDLHLRNISLWQGKITLFDCIEFNEPFRFVDVMYDVAFMVMDLEVRDSLDFANAFLNSYVEQTGDWEGLQVLPLYLSRQAYVRAKVTSFLLDDPAVPEAAKEEAAATAASYYKLAWQYTQPQNGQLILMSGLSGSGKTTVARKIARRLRAIHLRSDAVRKHLGGVGLEQPGGADLYTAEMSQKTYDRLLELGTTLASQGFSVILDAKYDRSELRGDAIAKAQSYDLPIKIVHCTAPLEVLRDRLSKRTGDVSDATPELVAQQQATAEPFSEIEQPLVIALDTTQDWQSQLDKLITNN
jgi:aminoglycoside phosphotransferase family enzyme/predicted kinase